MKFLAGFIAGIVLALVLGARPANSVDVPGRAQTWAALQASVALVSYGGSPPRMGGAYCAGTIVDSHLVLTAFHCTRWGDNAYVVTYLKPDTVVSTKVVWRRQGADLALLQTSDPLEGKIAQLAPDVARGEDLVLVGAPNSGTISVPFMVTKGIVGQILTLNFGANPYKCEDTSELQFGNEDHQVILTDAQSYFGNSGGGAFNISGQLLGVLVRGESATILGNECKPYEGEAILWSYVVGLDELRKIPKP